MKDLLVTIARGLVDDKDAVTVTVDEPNAEGVIYTICMLRRTIWAESSANRAELRRQFVL